MSTEREAFEAWGGDQGYPLRRIYDEADQQYLDLRTQGAWEAWQAARAQPAQAGALLTDADIDMCFGGLMPSGNGKSRYDIARQIEQAVRSKLGAGVPMTDAQMRAAFAMAHPQDHADMQDGSPANAVERIGARNVYRRFERGIRAAERHHGIVGKEGA